MSHGATVFSKSWSIWRIQNHKPPNQKILEPFTTVTWTRSNNCFYFSFGQIDLFNILTWQRNKREKYICSFCFTYINILHTKQHAYYKWTLWIIFLIFLIFQARCTLMWSLRLVHLYCFSLVLLHFLCVCYIALILLLRHKNYISLAKPYFFSFTFENYLTTNENKRTKMICIRLFNFVILSFILPFFFSFYFIFSIFVSFCLSLAVVVVLWISHIALNVKLIWQAFMHVCVDCTKEIIYRQWKEE